MVQAPAECLLRLDSDGSDLRDGSSADRSSPALILAELQHRFRNVVTLTQSLVSQTLREGVSIEHARETLNQRLAAMGTAVDLLLQGERQHGSLTDTIRVALAVHVSFDDRIHLVGPDLPVGGHAALALTLALHELATNATKYGALSVAHGSVDVTWTLLPGSPDPKLSLTWVERGGPLVTPPTREGFGSRLISTATARALAGQAELSFSPTGVTWILVAPLERVAL